MSQMNGEEHCAAQDLESFLKDHGFRFSRFEMWDFFYKKKRAFYFAPDGEEVLLSEAVDMIRQKMMREPRKPITESGYL